MISKQEILDRAQEWQLRPNIVEKDYVIGWLLWGIANSSSLHNAWVFKGGTCLKKCFIETYRFSEDLDFTVLSGGPLKASDLQKTFPDFLKLISHASGINFSVSTPRFKDRPEGGSTEVRIYYQGPLQAPTPAGIKFDITEKEIVVQPPVLRDIAHPYSDEFPLSDVRQVRCYGLEEVFAEKIRALGQRCRPRDLYDVINLFWRPDLKLTPDLILEILKRKCESKGISIPTYESLVNSPFRAELEGEWANMLGHQLPALPPIDIFLDGLENVFKWLMGKFEPTALISLSIEKTDVDYQWTPPPTVWAWGQGIPLESVRFAGSNRLCVDLTYNSTIRRIEPYSLRRTRAGHVLLYARKSQTGEIRAYRVERIEGIKVTTQPFIPKYKVEFSPTGPINSPMLVKSSIGASVNLRGHARRVKHSGPTYIIRCPYCNKEFKRTTRNLTLRTHNDSYGYSKCPGSGRRGALVDTRY